MCVTVLDYGCTITSLLVPDQHGNLWDVVLGFDDFKSYLNSPHYIGALIGRYANRIAHGRFQLQQQGHTLSRNHFNHHLHGGFKGLDKVVWSANPFENEQGCGIDFTYQSKDGDEGYPGNLTVGIRYFLNHTHALLFNYAARCDAPTIINLTQHSYFNLNEESPNILNHQLQINANYFLPVNEELIPTGEFMDVDKTPFDFRNKKEIGLDIFASDVQLQFGKGYDHCYVLDKKAKELNWACTLSDPLSGIKMEVHTTEPGMQLYTAQFIDGSGKKGKIYGPYAGVCLETQHFPDSPNHSRFPSVELHPEDQFQSTTLLLFGGQ